MTLRIFTAIVLTSCGSVDETTVACKQLLLIHPYDICASEPYVCSNGRLYNLICRFLKPADVLAR